VSAPSFLDCVAAVAAEERQRARDRGADAELIDIAYWSRASQGAVSRFENSHSQPRDLDRLLLAYAKVCEIPAAQILREAIERWEQGGGAEPLASEIRHIAPANYLSELPADERAARAVERPAPRSPAPRRGARKGPADDHSDTPDR
jgi:hypothetical protein